MHDILQIQSNTDNAQQSDPSMDLQKTAADKGFVVCDNPASGDCMFYALSHQLQSTKGIEILHRQLRCDLVQFLERYPNQVSQCSGILLQLILKIVCESCLYVSVIFDDIIERSMVSSGAYTCLHVSCNWKIITRFLMQLLGRPQNEVYG